MVSLDIREHASLESLLRAYIREKNPEMARASSGRALVFAEPFIAGAALVAHWILEFAPELLEKASLRISIVAPVPGQHESAAGAQAYELLPRFLGREQLPIAVSFVTPDASETNLRTPESSIKAYGLPLHAYLENAPDGFVDLLVFHDADAVFPESRDWAVPLARAIAQGTKVAAVAVQEDEHLLIDGLLGLNGFRMSGSPVKNRFAPKFPWGGLIWEVVGGRVPSPTEDAAPDRARIDEVSQLLGFVNRYIEVHGRFPPLQQYGVRVAGKESPALDGAPMLRLPEGIYFDPVAERFSGLTPDGPVSIHELDELGRSSALLASFDGRSDRFHQVLWAVRVFFECGAVLPPLLAAYMQEDPAPDDEDPKVCEECGGVHTAAERVDTMKEYLSQVFQGESPRTQVRAALELALDIVKRGGGVPDSRPDLTLDDDEVMEMSELNIFESLLNSAYLRAAWALVQDSECMELVEEGEDDEGWSLPMLLVEYAEWDLLESFLDGGGDISIGSSDGGTVFHALACGDEPVPHELLLRLLDALSEWDIDADTPDEAGIFPLEAAVGNDSWHAVAQLIDAGADIGETALDVKSVAAGLLANGFEKQAQKLAPKPRPKRTRKSSQPPAG